MSEREIIRKWVWAWDFERGDQWLNMMAESGKLLDKVGFCRYEFIPCEPGAYHIRLEMHDNDPAYIAFMQETGAEYIGRVAKWVYFRRSAAQGPFDLFSDIDSRMTHLRRIDRALRAVTLANIFIGVVNSIAPVPHVGWINLLCAVLTAYGAGRIQGKIESLNKARQLHE